MTPLVRRRTDGMRQRVTAAFGLALGALAAGASAWAVAGDGPPVEGPCAKPLAERVQRRYEGVQDLAAHFEQITERVAFGAGGGRADRAHGEAVFAKPGRMRWTYKTPEPSLVVSDGDWVWLYEPQAQEAQRLPLGRAFLSGAAIHFLLGRGNLLDEFRVDAGPCDEAPTLLRLSPRQDAPYERLELRVDPTSGDVRETTVVDLFGNVTRVKFQDVRINGGTDPSWFRFTPPEGVRVLELPRAP